MRGDIQFHGLGVVAMPYISEYDLVIIDEIRQLRDQKYVRDTKLLRMRWGIARVAPPRRQIPIGFFRWRRTMATWSMERASEGVLLKQTVQLL